MQTSSENMTETTGTGDATEEGAADQMKQQAQQVVQQTQQTAGQALDQATQQAKSLAAVQKDKASQSLAGIAQALRQTGQQLEQQGQGPMGQVANRAADQTERLAGYLEARDINQIMAETESLARRQPAIFLGAAFALGFLATRFFKSSSPSQPGSRDWAAMQQNWRAGDRLDQRLGYGTPTSQVEQFPDYLPATSEVEAYTPSTSEGEMLDESEETSEVVFDSSPAMTRTINGTST